MFTVYSKPNCPFCVQAKALLTQHGKSYEEIHLDFGQALKEGEVGIDRNDFFEQFPTQKSLPLILDASKNRIGGFTELREFLEYDF